MNFWGGNHEWAESTPLRVEVLGPNSEWDRISPSAQYPRTRQPAVRQSFQAAQLCRPNPGHVHPYAGFVVVSAFRPAAASARYWAARVVTQPKKSAPTVPTPIGPDICQTLSPLPLGVPDCDIRCFGLDRHQRIATLTANRQSRRAGRGWVKPSPFDRALLTASIPAPKQYDVLWLCASGWQSQICDWPAKWAVDALTNDVRSDTRNLFAYFHTAELWQLKADLISPRSAVPMSAWIRSNAHNDTDPNLASKFRMGLTAWQRMKRVGPDSYEIEDWTLPPVPSGKWSKNAEWQLILKMLRTTRNSRPQCAVEIRAGEFPFVRPIFFESGDGGAAAVSKLLTPPKCSQCGSEGWYTLSFPDPFLCVRCLARVIEYWRALLIKANLPETPQGIHHRKYRRSRYSDELSDIQTLRAIASRKFVSQRLAALFNPKGWDTENCQESFYPCPQPRTHIDPFEYPELATHASLYEHLFNAVPITTLAAREEITPDAMGKRLARAAEQLLGFNRLFSQGWWTKPFMGHRIFFPDKFVDDVNDFFIEAWDRHDEFRRNAIADAKANAKRNRSGRYAERKAQEAAERAESVWAQVKTYLEDFFTK